MQYAKAATFVQPTLGPAGAFLVTNDVESHCTTFDLLLYILCPQQASVSYVSIARDCFFVSRALNDSSRNKLRTIRSLHLSVFFREQYGQIESSKFQC